MEAGWKENLAHLGFQILLFFWFRWLIPTSQICVRFIIRAFPFCKATFRFMTKGSHVVVKRCHNNEVNYAQICGMKFIPAMTYVRKDIVFDQQ